MRTVSTIDFRCECVGVCLLDARRPETSTEISPRRRTDASDRSRPSPAEWHRTWRAHRRRWQPRRRASIHWRPPLRCWLFALRLVCVCVCMEQTFSWLFALRRSAIFIEEMDSTAKYVLQIIWRRLNDSTFVRFGSSFVYALYLYMHCSYSVCKNTNAVLFVNKQKTTLI